MRGPGARAHGERLAAKAEAVSIWALVRNGSCSIEDARELIAVPAEVEETLRRFTRVADAELFRRFRERMRAVAEDSSSTIEDMRETIAESLLTVGGGGDTEMVEDALRFRKQASWQFESLLKGHYLDVRLSLTREPRPIFPNEIALELRTESFETSTAPLGG